MKYLNGILLSTVALVSTVSAQATVLDYLSTAGTYLYTNLGNWDLWDGIILGLQQDSTDETHQCYLSFEEFSSEIDKLPAFIDSLATSSASDNSMIQQFTDNPYLMPGTYFKVAKRLSETGSVFFEFYR